MFIMVQNIFISTFTTAKHNLYYLLYAVWLLIYYCLINQETFTWNFNLCLILSHVISYSKAFFLIFDVASVFPDIRAKVPSALRATADNSSPTVGGPVCYVFRKNNCYRPDVNVITQPDCNTVAFIQVITPNVIDIVIIWMKTFFSSWKHTALFIGRNLWFCCVGYLEKICKHTVR